MVAFAENKILKGGAAGPTGDTAILNADSSTPSAGTQPLVNNLYQGMTLDAVTGLYYERFRNYSPSLGAWTSQDPAGYVNGANTYRFVASSPVGRVDAEGLGGGNPNFNPSPPPLSPRDQALVNEYSGRNAANYPANQPPPFDGAGGAVLGPLLAGGWYFTGRTGREVIGYTQERDANVDGACVKEGYRLYAPTAEIQRGSSPSPSDQVSTGLAIGVLLAIPGVDVPVATLFVLWPLYSALVANAQPKQSEWIRVAGPLVTGRTLVPVPGA
jgi:RHS repeat-associated protein